MEQLQLDELYAVLRDLKVDEINDDEAIKSLERSSWSKLLVVSTWAAVLGDGTLFEQMDKSLSAR